MSLTIVIGFVADLKASKQKNVGIWDRTLSLHSIMSLRCCSFSGPDPRKKKHFPISDFTSLKWYYRNLDSPSNSSTLISIFFAQCTLIGSDIRIICATDSPSLENKSYFWLWTKRGFKDPSQRSTGRQTGNVGCSTYFASNAAARKSLPAFRLPLNKIISFGCLAFMFFSWVDPLLTISAVSFAIRKSEDHNKQKWRLKRLWTLWTDVK